VLGQCNRRHALLLPRDRAFLAAYREADGPVPASEEDLLVPFMRATRLIEILLDMTNAVRGGYWDAEYTLHNLWALANLAHVPPPALWSG
jgi:hypothetical protein